MQLTYPKDSTTGPENLHQHQHQSDSFMILYAEILLWYLLNALAMEASTQFRNSVTIELLIKMFKSAC